MAKKKSEEVEDVNKKLDLAITQLDRQFGRGTIMKLDANPKPWPSISTGSLNLDVALGIGGYPEGRITEIYGPESSGKTTLALTAIANAQRAGHKCLFIDAEHALDPGYAKSLGVNIEDLIFAQPTTGEEAMQILDNILNTGAIKLAVIDSVPALTPKAELEGEMGDSHVGRLPRLMAQVMRKVTGSTSETKTSIIFINQIREKIGVMFGNPETQPGGRALKFHASQRLDIRKIETLVDKSTGENMGHKVRVKIVKNKMAPPYKKAEFEILYGKGINYAGSVIEAGEQYGVINKKGAWYSYDGEQLGQGMEKASAALIENPEMTEKIVQKIWQEVRGEIPEEYEEVEEEFEDEEPYYGDDERADQIDAMVDRAGD